MNLTCQRPQCGKEFEASTWVGYCPQCVQVFRDFRKAMGRAQNPVPGIHLDGQFSDDKSMIAHSFQNPIDGKVCCGLCGCDEIHPGYGLGTGFGMASYNFCAGCRTFIDIVPDNDDE